MIENIDGKQVGLPEVDHLFKHHLSTHGISFVKQLERMAQEDPGTAADESINICITKLTDAIRTMLAPELQELSFLNMGLSQRAKLSLANLIRRVDKLSHREGGAKKPLLSALSSFEDIAYESYDDDFEEMSSPEKSESVLSTELEGGSPMMRKPPVGATSATPGRTVLKRRGSSPSRARDREWIAKGNWRIGEKIGSGSFGEVFKGLKNDGKIVAVKRLRITAGRSEELLNLANEIDLMRNMSHPNIVSYIGTKVDMDKEVVYIFQEWVSGGSVNSMLANFGPFQLDVIRTYTSQILLGLQYLHENGIVHRDIKGGNILVENSGSVKLADFGASTKVAMGDTEESTAIRGTPYFSPPENLYEVKYGRKGDIWAVGCTVVEMLTGRPPWQSDTVTTVVQLYMHIVATKGPPPYSRELPDDAEDFLKVIFKIDPKERPTAIDLQTHPFLSPDNYEDSMENSSYGGSSVGSNIYGSSSVDLLRLREVESKRSVNRKGNDAVVGSVPTFSKQPPIQVPTTTSHTYRQKAGLKGLKADTAYLSSDENGSAQNYEVGDRVEALFAGLAKWIPGTIRKCHKDKDGGFDVEYENGKTERRVVASLIRHPDGDNRSSPRSETSPSNGNPFARQISPSSVKGIINRQPSSPLPSVLKTPGTSPVKEASGHAPIVLTNWDAIYKSESCSELPSPFKSTPQKEMSGSILSAKSRGTRTAPGVSRDPDNVEMFPEGALAKKESRRDVRTAGNASDLAKDKRNNDVTERRKGSRRAAGRVARVVSESAPSGEATRTRSMNRIGPAQILRDARKGSNFKKIGADNMSSLALAEDDDSLPTIFSANFLETDASIKCSIVRSDKKTPS